MGNDTIRATGWRRVAAAIWGQPSDPQIYGDFEVDATALVAFIEDTRRATGTRVTVTHVVGKAIAYGLAQNPDLNTRLYRGRFTPRESVDIFFASVAGGNDVSGVKVKEADRKSVVEIAGRVRQVGERIRPGGDAEVEARPASSTGCRCGCSGRR